MRIIIVTQDDCFYLPIFFKRFLNLLNKDRLSVILIIILAPFNENLFRLIKRMYNFYGPRHFFKLSIKYIFLRILNNLNILEKSITQMARSNGIPIEKIKDINNIKTVMEIKRLNPDIILSVAATQIFKEKILNIPKYGCINIHSAKLPKYRGMMPTFWAMYHDEKKLGITIHLMDKEIDRGKIILQREIEIYPQESLDSLIKRSKKIAAELAINALDKIKNGTVNFKNCKGKGSYFSFPTRANIKTFKKRGKKLI